jgi:hypothetical protein
VAFQNPFGDWSVIAVEELSHFVWAAALYGIAAIVLALGRVTRDILNYRLARRALKKKNAKKALRDVAKVIEAQRGERRRRRRKKKPRKALSGDPSPTSASP